MIRPRVEAVVFDLDNTLYNEAIYFEAVLDKLLREIGRKDVVVTGLVDIGDRLKARDYLGDLLKKLSLYTEEMQQRAFALYCGLDQMISLEKDVATSLKFLRSKNVKLGIVTNGVVEAQKSKVHCLSLEELVDDIVYARSLGKWHEKPHPGPFQEICKKLMCEPARALFVGDHPVNDIEGASSAGLQTAWLRNPHLPGPVQSDLIVSSIDELIGKITNEP